MCALTADLWFATEPCPILAVSVTFLATASNTLFYTNTRILPYTLVTTLASPLEFPQHTALPLVGRSAVSGRRARDRAGPPKQVSELLLLGCRRWGHVGVERAGLGFRDVSVGQTGHREAALPATGHRDFNLIVDMNLVVWLSTVPVEQDPSGFAGTLCL